MQWPKPEVAALAVDGDAHCPAFTTACIDLEIEAAAIGMPAGFVDVFDGSDREPLEALRVARTH